MDNAQILQELYNSNDLVTIKSVEEGFIRKVHKSILEYHSDVLKTMFSNGMQESKSLDLIITNFPSKIIDLWIKLMYSFWDLIKEITNAEIFHLLQICDFYNTNLIKDRISSYLKSKICDENFVEIAGLAESNSPFSQEIITFLMEKLKKDFQILLDKNIDIDIMDFSNCEEQFKEHCYDLCPPNRYSHRMNRAICCCKHKDKKKSFLTRNEKADIKVDTTGEICCISKSLSAEEKVNGNNVYREFCCSHKKKEVVAERINFLNKFKKEFDIKKESHDKLKNIISALTPEFQLQFFHSLFYLQS